MPARCPELLADGYRRGQEIGQRSGGKVLSEED